MRSFHNFGGVELPRTLLCPILANKLKNELRRRCHHFYLYDKIVTNEKLPSINFDNDYSVFNILFIRKRNC